MCFKFDFIRKIYESLTHTHLDRNRNVKFMSFELEFKTLKI